MERPRCSRPDLDLDLEEDPGHRQKRYQYLNQAKYLWGQNGLRMPVTVGFTNYWPGMSQSDQEWVALQCASVSTTVLAIPSLIQLISIKYNMLCRRRKNNFTNLAIFTCILTLKERTSIQSTPLLPKFFN